MEDGMTDQDRRGLVMLGKVALFSIGAAALLVGASTMLPQTPRTDAVKAAKVRAEIAACHAAKPEIEAAARGIHDGLETKWRLKDRITEVNRHDPSQCGTLLRNILDTERQNDFVVMAGVTAG